ncbi:MAG TPA: DUF1150 family protein [Alphaproteobacteria bacterium]|nr:DUF1150 family protein [Alphaproteobacteria bacterium]
MENKTTEKMLPLSQQEFALLGMNDLAYVRPVEVEGQSNFMIHAADGSLLGVGDSRELAMAAARRHGLDPQIVH